MTKFLTIDGTCPGDTWQENYEDWIAGGFSACALSIGGTSSAMETIGAIARTYQLVRNDNRMTLALGSDDIRRAHVDGKLAVYLQFQGTQELAYEAEMVEVFWRLGVRIMGLAYNRRGPVCDGCEEPVDAGVSRLGRMVISEMNRVGMIVDVSHTGWRSSAEAIEMSTRPTVASHSNAHGVRPHPRNLPDDLITAIARSGGVIGMNGFPAFVADKTEPTIDDLIDHMVYIDNLVGATGFVGLGLDYCEMDERTYDRLIADGTWTPASYPRPPWNYPDGIRTPRTTSAICERMIKRGYTDEDVRGVLGGNWLRVFDSYSSETTST